MDVELEKLRKRFHDREAPPTQSQPEPASESETPGDDVEEVVVPERRFPVGLNRDPKSDYGRFVFRDEGYGCVAFNGVEDLPSMDDPTYVWPRFLKNMHMCSNEYPYAAYVLKNPRYDNSEFLSRLNISFYSVPYERLGDERTGFLYRMAPDKAYAWQRLENAVLITVKVIRRYYDCFYNLSFSPPRLPSSYGYLGTYATLKDLRRRVMTSRDSFDLLFAYMTYYISGTPTTTMTSAVDAKRYVFQYSSGRTSGEDTLHASLPFWAQIAIDDGLLHPVWIDMILFSEISNFTKPRAGVCIDPDNCEFLYTIARLLARNVKLVFKWPLLADDYAMNKLWELAARVLPLVKLTPDERKRLLLEWKNEAERPRIIRPPHAGLAAAREAQWRYMHHLPPAPTDHPSPRPSGDGQLDKSGDGIASGRQPALANHPVPVSSGDDGQVNERGDGIPQTRKPWDLNHKYVKSAWPRNGQLENEHWSAFLDRRVEKNKRIEEKQSNQEKVTRLSWIANARDGTLMNGSKVYAWEKETEDGVRYRNHLSKFEGRMRFDSCKESTRIYDPYENCWDICSEFDFPVEEGNTYSFDEEDRMLDNDEFTYDDSPIQHVAERVPLHRISTETSVSAQEPPVFDDWAAFILSATDFNDITAEGFKRRADATARAFVHLELTMRKIHGFLPTSNSYPNFESPIDNVMKDSIMEVARKMLGDGTSELKDDWSSRRNIFNFALAVGESDPAKRRPEAECALWDISPGHANYGWKRNSGVEVASVSRQFGDKYLSVFRIEVRREPNWTVELLVPDAMIAVACMRMNFESGRELFHFLSTRGCEFRAIPKHPESIQAGRVVPVLGWRKKGYVPGIADYVAYVRRVEALLEHRLVAALRMGGLYWRLAMFYCRENVTTDTFLNCLFMEVEPLTESEQDILIGKYHIYTGRGIQSNSSSWWPQKNLTEGSFLDAGYWSPSCEAWFRCQLETFAKSIANQKQSLKTAKVWRKAMKSLKPAVRFTQRQRKVSRAYIEDGA